MPHGHARRKRVNRHGVYRLMEAALIGIFSMIPSYFETEILDKLNKFVHLGQKGVMQCYKMLVSLRFGYFSDQLPQKLTKQYSISLSHVNKLFKFLCQDNWALEIELIFYRRMKYRMNFFYLIQYGIMPFYCKMIYNVNATKSFLVESSDCTFVSRSFE